MIVTNKQIQKGELDNAILKQIKALCNDFVFRYPDSFYNDKDEKPFQLGFRLKDINEYR